MSPLPPAEAVTPALVRGWPLPQPDDHGDKHDRGTVLVVGGATSTPGAVLLAGLAALRAGAGRLQVATVATTSVQLAVALPEAQVLGLTASPAGSLDGTCADDLRGPCEAASAVVVGPGLLGRADTTALLTAVLPALPGPVVLDAVALTTLAGRPELAAGLSGRLVLTPNSGELAALLEGEDLAGQEAAARVAQRYGAVVVSKGWVAAPDGRTWRAEAAGGPALATSGSGDVLAGTVGGLLARGAQPEQAAVVGQWAHAAAGDRLGRLGFLARELLDELPVVLASLR